MKQNNEMDIVDIPDDNEVVNMDEDIVEEFARQLDQIVRIQDQQQQGLVGEDDESDDDNGYDVMGYQQLPQGDDEQGDDGYYQQLESENEEEEEESVDIKAPVSIEITSSNSLDSDTSDLIKSIMNNIKLPDEAVPDWAKKIPESAWFPRVNLQDKNK